MSISSLSTSNLSAIYQRPPQPRKDAGEGLDTLKQAIQSGDLDSTRKAYDSLAKLKTSDKATSGSSPSADGSDPMSSMLSKLGEALESGDMAKVEETFAAYGPQKNGQGGRGGPGADGPPPGGPPPGGGPSDEVKSALGDLSQSLQSGDLESAQASYSSLLDLLGDDAEDGADGGTGSASASGSSGSSAAGSSAGGLPDTLLSTLGDLGSALQSGNLSGAQQLFASLAPRGSQSVDVSA